MRTKDIAERVVPVSESPGPRVITAYAGMMKWVPAFAGMTKWVPARLTARRAGMVKWVPAFAGMTKGFRRSPA